MIQTVQSRLIRQTSRLSDQQVSFLDKLGIQLGCRNRSETIRWVISLARLVWANLGAKFLLTMFHAAITFIVIERTGKGKTVDDLSIDLELVKDLI